jgi:hypothetical protein
VGAWSSGCRQTHRGEAHHEHLLHHRSRRRRGRRSGILGLALRPRSRPAAPRLAVRWRAMRSSDNLLEDREGLGPPGRGRSGGVKLGGTGLIAQRPHPAAVAGPRVARVLHPRLLGAARPLVPNRARLRRRAPVHGSLQIPASGSRQCAHTKSAMLARSRALTRMMHMLDAIHRKRVLMTMRPASWPTSSWKPSLKMCWRKSSAFNSERSRGKSPRHEPQAKAPAADQRPRCKAKRRRAAVGIDQGPLGRRHSAD